MAESIKLIFLSFLASIGFGLKYQMQRRYLIWAGLGGALTRLCYLLLVQFIDARQIFVSGDYPADTRKPDLQYRCTFFITGNRRNVGICQSLRADSAWNQHRVCTDFHVYILQTGLLSGQRPRVSSAAPSA